VSDSSIEHAGFTIERRFDAPPAKVFSAWADRRQGALVFRAG
jgi:uncharacterized protein YndB with AHSA1/START domain